MKKYARLRSTSSVTEQCEPRGVKLPEVPTTLALDDDVGAFAAPKWRSTSDGSNASANTKHDQGEDVSSSASHRVLAEALKKLSSLRETQHEDDPGLPRGVINSVHWGARNNHVVDADAGSGELANSSSFAAGRWRRPGQSAGAADEGSHCSQRTDYVDAAAAAVAAASGSMRTTRPESCTHMSHFTHRRSSSMHDIVLSQPAARLAPLHLDQNRRRAGKSGISCFPDEKECGWSPPRLRCATGSADAATAPPARRLSADPLQTSCRLWEEEDSPFGTAGRSAAKRANGVQSMRYDHLHGGGSGGWTASAGGGKLDLGERAELQSQSVREGAAHASAIAAMAQAYAEKYGVAQAVVECVSCGRGLGVIVEGNSPGSYDSSFCRSCRPPVLPVQAVTSAASSSSSKKGGAGALSRGMMHYCRKLLLRVGRKPSHKYTLV